jgi:hypothetical protein
MAYVGKFSYKDIGYLGVSMPNDSAAPLTDADIGKTVAWGTDGVVVAADQKDILGVFVAMDKAGTITVQLSGAAYVGIADSSTVKPGDFVVGNGSGGVALLSTETSGATTPKTAKVIHVEDATTVVVWL